MARCRPDDSLVVCIRKIRTAYHRAERALARELLAQWTPQRDWLRAQIAALLDEVAAARETGLEPLAQLYRLQRWQALERELSERIARLGAALEGRAVALKRDEAQAGAELAAKVAEVAGMAPGAVVNFLAGFPEMEAALVSGLMADGAPLARYFAERVGQQALTAVREEVLRAVVLGQNPRRAARLIARRVAAIPLARAMTIARTEALRAQREATRLGYREMGVRQWQRVAALDGRTCPVCWALHGTRYPVSEPFRTHPNCRCTMMPVLPGVDFGIPTAQDALLALRRHQVWENFGRGRTYLMRSWPERFYEDMTRFVAWDDHPIFGPTPRLRPTRDLFRQAPWLADEYEILSREGLGRVMHSADSRFYDYLLRRRVAPSIRDLAGRDGYFTALEVLYDRGLRAVVDGAEVDVLAAVGRDGVIMLSWHSDPNHPLSRYFRTDLDVVHTLAHEFFHTVSAIEPQEYLAMRGIEEGPVEALARWWMDETFGHIRGARWRSGYLEYVEPLEAFVRAAGVWPDEGLVELLALPTIRERALWVARVGIEEGAVDEAEAFLRAVGMSRTQIQRIMREARGGDGE